MVLLPFKLWLKHPCTYASHLLPEKIQWFHGERDILLLTVPAAGHFQVVWLLSCLVLRLFITSLTAEWQGTCVPWAEPKALSWTACCALRCLLGFLSFHSFTLRIIGFCSFTTETPRDGKDISKLEQNNYSGVRLESLFSLSFFNCLLTTAPTRQSFKSKTTRPAQKAIRAVLQKYMHFKKGLILMGGEAVIQTIYRPMTLAVLLLLDDLLVVAFFCKDWMYITGWPCHSVTQGLELGLQPLLGGTVQLTEDNWRITWP